VEALTVRLLPQESANGPHNMAADEALLQSAQSGLTSLRFYGWTEPTVSLGYFQAESLRRHDPLLGMLPYVRRPSGGAMLVHHHELTYALALPASRVGRGALTWLKRMHEIIAGALRDLGVETAAHVPRDAEHGDGFLCFQQFCPGDLLIGRAKVVGSAQRRQRGALLQHGAILLAASPHTPTLPGIKELTGTKLSRAELLIALCDVFAQATGWRIREADWTESERQTIRELLALKYGTASWNARR